MARGLLRHLFVAADTNRINQAVKLVNPLAAEDRVRRKVGAPKLYVGVKGVHLQWSADCHLKAICPSMVIFGCREAHTRKIIYLLAVPSKAAFIHLALLDCAALAYGQYPGKFRIDAGRENVKAAA
eukprot:gene8436-17786_t